MRINHVIKTDQWRSALQIRPAPHFVVSRAYFNVLLICLQKYTNKGEQSRSARGTSGGAYLPDRHAASSCMTTNNEEWVGNTLRAVSVYLPAFAGTKLCCLVTEALPTVFLHGGVSAGSRNSCQCAPKSEAVPVTPTRHSFCAV